MVESLTASSLSFSSDFVREVHASASVKRRSHERRKTRAAAYSHARGRLHISHVLLDGSMKKRDCS